MQVENHGNYIRVINGNAELEIHEDGTTYLSEQQLHGEFKLMVVQIKLNDLSEMIDLARKEQAKN